MAPKIVTGVTQDVGVVARADFLANCIFAYSKGLRVNAVVPDISKSGMKRVFLSNFPSPFHVLTENQAQGVIWANQTLHEKSKLLALPLEGLERRNQAPSKLVSLFV